MTTATTSPQHRPDTGAAGAERPSGAAGSAAGSAPFSTVLREATREEHTAAETRGFITRLMGGELEEGDYWRLLAQYLPVYEALEQSIAAAAEVDPLAAAFHDARLARVAAIRCDLAARFGKDAEVDPPLPVTERYARRIREATVPQLRPTTTCAISGTSRAVRPSARSSLATTRCRAGSWPCGTSAPSTSPSA